jgi:hypothetical protein
MRDRNFFQNRTCLSLPPFFDVSSLSNFALVRKKTRRKGNLRDLIDSATFPLLLCGLIIDSDLLPGQTLGGEMSPSGGKRIQ